MHAQGHYMNTLRRAVSNHVTTYAGCQLECQCPEWRARAWCSMGLLMWLALSGTLRHESQPRSHAPTASNQTPSFTMSDQPSTRRFLLRWESVSLVLLFLKAVAKYSQTITTTLTSLLWRNAHASRSVPPHTHRSSSSSPLPQ